MGNNTHALLQILVMAIFMFLLRCLPFVIFSKGSGKSGFLTYLGKVLPFATIGMLVVYCLKDVSLIAYPYGLPEFIAAAAVVGLHVWRKNTLLSVFSGTLFYMFLVQFIF